MIEFGYPQFIMVFFLFFETSMIFMRNRTKIAIMDIWELAGTFLGVLSRICTLIVVLYYGGFWNACG